MEQAKRRTLRRLHCVLLSEFTARQTELLLKIWPTLIRRPEFGTWRSNARIVLSSGIRTNQHSDTLDAVFRPGKGIESVTQQDSFAYVDGDRKAWAKRARYTPADHMLVLTGSPRVVDGGMTTTASSMKMDRSTGDAIAEGDVKSTYSDLKAQPNGALLASSSPIHVTAKTMTAHKSPSVAIYSGNARLWQDANVIEAPSIQFDRDHRSVIANAANGKLVSMLVNQADSNNKVTPLTVNSAHLTYTDNERKAHFDGNVVAKWTDLTITSRTLDVFLQAHSEGIGKFSKWFGKIRSSRCAQPVIINQQASGHWAIAGLYRRRGQVRADRRFP
jgi:lipopolysaccharide export system protein LptA